jgi:hypothetical protein
MKYAIYILYGISVMSILLGFVALLKQKTYINEATKEVTEVELPLVGKLKTNYPSLVFLAMGIFLAVFVFNKSYNTKKVWEISGRFIDTTKTITNWSEGELNIQPSAIRTKDIDSLGNYHICLELNDGQEIEDIVELITYTNQKLSYNFQPSEEKKKNQKKDNSSLLAISTTSTRIYKPATLSYFEH